MCVVYIAHADGGTRATPGGPLTHDPTHDDVCVPVTGVCVS